MKVFLSQLPYSFHILEISAVTTNVEGYLITGASRVIFLLISDKKVIMLNAKGIAILSDYQGQEDAQRMHLESSEPDFKYIEQL